MNTGSDGRGSVTLTQGPPGTVWIPGQSAIIGSDAHDDEEAPARSVTVDGFWMQAHQVTNEQFARFVADTGYVTVAQRPRNPTDYSDAPGENLQPGSMVFQATPGPVDLRHPGQWWTWTPGAAWNHPLGPGSTIEGHERHPVVHVAFEDAQAYARWADLDLPTEAQWEVAARGGLPHAEYTWGDRPEAPWQPLANYWHGEFPYLPDTGYGQLAPVGSFPPNAYGLYDMAGNAWDWTVDRCGPRRDEHPGCAPASVDPARPGFGVPRQVIKGGSFLCADGYCVHYRPAARQPQAIDTGTSHIGFRCIKRADPPNLLSVRGI